MRAVADVGSDESPVVVTPAVRPARVAGLTNAQQDLLNRIYAEPAGFEVKAVRVSEIGPRGRGVTFAGALFEGVLEVRDAGAFRSALETGIGPAKAFGFGLLSLSRSPK